MRKYQNYIINDDDYRSANSSQGYAQTFTPEISHKIQSVKLEIYRVSTPGNCTVSIRNTSAGEPLGIRGTEELLSKTFNADDLSTSPTWVEITFPSGLRLNVGTMYAIVLFSVASSTRWRVDETSPTYTRGAGWWFFAGSWIAQTMDFMFEEWGVPLTGPLPMSLR